MYAEIDFSTFDKKQWKQFKRDYMRCEFHDDYFTMPIEQFKRFYGECVCSCDIPRPEIRIKKFHRGKIMNYLICQDAEILIDNQYEYSDEDIREIYAALKAAQPINDPGAVSLIDFREKLIFQMEKK